jgi:hypothetical protein
VGAIFYWSRIHDHPILAAERLSNKANVALQTMARCQLMTRQNEKGKKRSILKLKKTIGCHLAFLAFSAFSVLSALSELLVLSVFSAFLKLSVFWGSRRKCLKVEYLGRIEYNI